MEWPAHLPIVGGGGVTEQKALDAKIGKVRVSKKAKEEMKQVLVDKSASVGNAAA